MRKNPSNFGGQNERSGGLPASNRSKTVWVERNLLDVVHVLFAVFIDDGIVQ